MVGDANLGFDEQAFSVALATLAENSRSFRRAIDIADGDNDHLASVWVGESATAHSNRWVEFVAAAHHLVDQLDLSQASVEQVAHSIVVADHETEEHMSLLDLA